jgi:hypothetical protein
VRGEEGCYEGHGGGVEGLARRACLLRSARGADAHLWERRGRSTDRCDLLTCNWRVALRKLRRELRDSRAHGVSATSSPKPQNPQVYDQQFSIIKVILGIEQADRMYKNILQRCVHVFIVFLRFCVLCFCIFAFCGVLCVFSLSVLDKKVRDVNMYSIILNTSCKRFRYYEVLLMKTGAHATTRVDSSRSFIVGRARITYHNRLWAQTPS